MWDSHGNPSMMEKNFVVNHQFFVGKEEVQGEG
jgi:hypothetical protein